MNTPATRTVKKPLRWVWFVVTPVLLITILLACFGPHLLREAIIRRLEAQGTGVLFNLPPGHPNWLQTLPGLEHFRVPVHIVMAKISSKDEAARLPQLLRDIRAIGGSLSIDLTGSDDLVRDVERLSESKVFNVEADDREISGAALSRLRNASALTGLCLTKCTFDSEAFAELGRLKTLQLLILDGSSIKDKDLRQLHGLPKLKRISLSNTQVSESAKEDLCKAISGLDLSDD